ncbi:1800_t:CDS:2 [Gigaspora rosea]|nr:1800_t:CDS:2 [Gigaspora rosea]
MEGNEIIKINYGLFGNFEEISRGPCGTVRKAIWEDKIIALKILEHLKKIQSPNNPEPELKHKRTFQSLFKKRLNSSENTPISEIQTYKHETTGETFQTNENFSTIITAEHKKKIITWIDSLAHEAQQEFKLILRGSDREILGGYNPLTWDKNKKRKEKYNPLTWDKNKKRNGPISSRLSRVENKDYAICFWNNLPSFGSLDLYMTEDAKFWGCCKADYEKPIKKKCRGNI